SNNNNNNELLSGYSPGTMSRYTVEQVELIRRLKATGITLQAIVDAPTHLQYSLQAFNDYHTVSAQLDSIPFPSPIPPIVATSASSSAESTPLTPVRPSSVVYVPTSLPGPSLVPVPAPSSMVPSIETTLASLMPSPVVVPSSMFLALQAGPMSQLGSAPSSMLHSSLAAAVAAAQAQAAAAVAQQQQQQALHPRLTPPVLTEAASAGSAASTSAETQSRSAATSQLRATPMREITTLDNPKELEEFMSNGEEHCISDMKAFITQYSLRQTTVAMMTGVSQPYISKLLNGNHRELSLRCRKNIYCWYLNCRRHPEKLNSFLADPSSRLETNGDGELVPQKRERYVFRPVLLRLLEHYFTETPFPDTQKRIEIATACNAALQSDKKGAGLMPKEVVSPQVVSNWFANKRKELRRKSDPRYQEPMVGLHPAIIEALERGANSVPELRSDTGSASPGDDDTMDGLEMQQQQPAARAAAPRNLPPPDYSIFEALGLAAPPSIFQQVKNELDIKDQF
ncbi:hypothetical protein PENTCL1PPCAC_24282, partial [Pristionchus entomophagus]